MLRPLSAAVFVWLAASFARGSGDVQWSGLDAALARSRAENKPIYVLACAPLNELCRATLDALRRPETAEFFNRHFVCVLLDRDARPDFAAAAQRYLREVKQMPGWPAQLWLTPQGEPYDGANYLPPGEEWGKKSLSEIARADAEAWEHQPAACRRQARAALALLRGRAPALQTKAESVDALAAEGFAAWNNQYDSAHPGFGPPPRYPEPELLRAMLARGGADRQRALAALRWLAASAVRDPLDGGFFRYAQDAGGALPYPQKLLSDQARLALAYLDAQAVRPEAVFAGAARGAIRYVLTTLARPDGLFALAQDGTDPRWTAFYAWKAADVARILGRRAGAFEAAFSVSPAGNVPADADPSGQYAGLNLLRRSAGLIPPAGEGELAADEAALLAARRVRGALPEDNRAEAAANGLFLSALVRAAEVLRDGHYAGEARRLGAGMKRSFLTSGGDVRRFAGQDDPGQPADYAAMALGFRMLDQARLAAAAEISERLIRRCDRLYLIPDGGGYAAAAEPLAPGVFIRAPAFLLADHEPAPEALALLAAPPPGVQALLLQALARRAASGSISGDTLLALGSPSAAPGR
jgi:hypothetical protein